MNAEYPSFFILSSCILSISLYPFFIILEDSSYHLHSKIINEEKSITVNKPEGTENTYEQLDFGDLLNLSGAEAHIKPYG